MPRPGLSRAFLFWRPKLRWVVTACGLLCAADGAALGGGAAYEARNLLSCFSADFRTFPHVAAQCLSPAHRFSRRRLPLGVLRLRHKIALIVGAFRDVPGRWEKLTP